MTGFDYDEKLSINTTIDNFLNNNYYNYSDYDDNHVYDDNNNTNSISTITIAIILQIFLYMCFVFMMMFLITYIVSVNLVRSIMYEQRLR